MRLLHTADWHLGRLFYGVHLTEDQAHVLDQFVDVVRDTQPDAVLIAGDVYDRAVPPPEAIQLLDETLCRIILDHKTPVILLAGNHDSPDRLGFASRLLSSHLLHVYGRPTASPQPVLLEDEHGAASLYALPYMEPMLAREVYATPEIACHQSAMEAALQRIIAQHPCNHRAILMGHAFVQGGEECESERPLSVGGAGSVAASVFEAFDYVAMGHLHRPQTIGRKVHYSGSLMKYSFAEADHQKSVTLVEMDASGNTQRERIPLPPRRDVRRVSGLLQELLDNPIGPREDYLEVSLYDPGALLDPIGKLREVYPNVLHLERPILRALQQGSGEDRIARDHRKTGPVEMFEAFFQEVTGQKLDTSQREAYVAMLEGLAQAEREASI